MALPESGIRILLGLFITLKEVVLPWGHWPKALQNMQGFYFEEKLCRNRKGIHHQDI